jgi:hypothetical protein
VSASCVAIRVACGLLEFHHLDPSKKRFGLSSQGITGSIELLRIEARKCALLCSNCHAEVEDGLVSVPINST